MSRQSAAPANEVQLTGRVSGDPTERELPSGDHIVQLRVVVPRPAPRRRRVSPAHADRREGQQPETTGGGAATRPAGRPRQQVDTIDVACWTARSRAAALRLADGAGVSVQGALRRRFFRTGGGPASRYEVEASSVRRVDLEA